MRMKFDSNVKMDKRMFLRFKQGSIKEEYFFDRKVGHGGFGIVYKAKNRITLKTVAIKAIQKFKLNDINLFKNEYNILMDLDHPNIINIHEIWEWEKMMFLVTEFCNGGDLFQYILDKSSL